jgi:hypothetical protein
VVLQILNYKETGEDCEMMLDSTDFPVTWQGKVRTAAFFSHKIKAAGLQYEIGICIKTGWIVWIHGPFPCGDWADITIFHHSLKNLLPKGEGIEADDGYGGEDPQLIKTPTGI